MSEPLGYKVTFASQNYERKISVLVLAQDAIEAIATGEAFIRSKHGGPSAFSSIEVLTARWVDTCPSTAPQVLSDSAMAHYQAVCERMTAALRQRK